MFHRRTIKTSYPFSHRLAAVFITTGALLLAVPSLARAECAMPVNLTLDKGVINILAATAQANCKVKGLSDLERLDCAMMALSLSDLSGKTSPTATPDQASGKSRSESEIELYLAKVPGGEIARKGSLSYVHEKTDSETNQKKQFFHGEIEGELKPFDHGVHHSDIALPEVKANVASYSKQCRTRDGAYGEDFETCGLRFGVVHAIRLNDIGAHFYGVAYPVGYERKFESKLSVGGKSLTLSSTSEADFGGAAFYRVPIHRGARGGPAFGVVGFHTEIGTELKAKRVGFELMPLSYTTDLATASNVTLMNFHELESEAVIHPHVAHLPSLLLGYEREGFTGATADENYFKFGVVTQPSEIGNALGKVLHPRHPPKDSPTLAP